ncbi:glycosyltransferase family 4 protein [Sphingomonas alba]|uniref:Glycosyltransferase family 4 protein n=1 Tax=Sphingomonas alba TaxID=2908208 RepID=A0ABT0RJA0_9SPHN|nr:glycosyltransferase family 4 protein [Sphingomonas alba]
MTLTHRPASPIAVIAANSAWNIANFRAPLITALRNDGWHVVALAPGDGSIAALETLGAEFVPIGIESSGTSPVGDARLLASYLRVLRRLRPKLFLGFTIKPNVYGSIAAHLLGIRVVNNISGLGTAFMKPGPLNWLVTRLYKLSLRGSVRVFFQNPHDRDLFVSGGLVQADQATVIPGSGIDLERFKPPSRARQQNLPFRFLFIGRLLRDKGLVEYAEAARLLRPSWPNVEFAVLGFAGSDNPSAVPMSEVRRWEGENLVSYLGETDDVRPLITDSDCIVLPSYREGLPRSLLEAAAMARPMIATDVPGCRDVVVNGENGFLCEPRSASSLASAMEAMLRLGPDERQAWGLKARTMVESKFDQQLVVDAYLQAAN